MTDQCCSRPSLALQLLPIFKSRGFVQCSPYLTGKQPERNVLLNFRGNAHLNQPQYSFGLRQQVWHHQR